MIKLEFGMAVGIYALLVLVSFIFLWWLSFSQRRSADLWNMTDYVNRCFYCGHVFLDYVRRKPMKCPLCESYLEASDAVQVKE